MTEAHFQNLLKGDGPRGPRRDPRFATNAGRVAHMDETDALVADWTRTLGKMEVFARTKQYRIPCAPVRNAPEVMNDPHMHERGMLEHIDHPELGEIVVPDDAVAPARHRQGRDPPEPDDRPAQRRNLRRLARPLRRGDCGIANRRRDLIRILRESDNHRWIIRKFDAPPRLLHALENLWEAGTSSRTMMMSSENRTVCILWRTNTCMVMVIRAINFLKRPLREFDAPSPKLPVGTCRDEE